MKNLLFVLFLLASPRGICQHVAFEPFDTEQGIGYLEPLCEPVLQSMDVPLLVPLSADDKVETPMIAVSGIKDTIMVQVSVNVRFDHDLRDTTLCVKPIEVYLRFLVFPNDKVLYDPQQIKSNKKLYLWSLINEKVINWMYRQPYTQYYNRVAHSPLYPNTPVLALNFIFQIKLKPDPNI